MVEITKGNARAYVENICIEASKKDPKNRKSNKYRTAEEWENILVRKTLKKFRRKALGLGINNILGLTKKKIMGLEEISNILYEIGIGSDIEESQKVAQNLIKANECDSNAMHIQNIEYLLINKVQDLKGNTTYRVKHYFH